MNVIAFFLLVSFLYTCFHVLTAKTRTTKLPPGPFPLPIIGNLLNLSDKPHASLAKLAETYGPLMSLKLGSVTTVVISSSNMAKEVLQKNDQAFSSRTIVEAATVNRHAEFSMVWLPVCQRWRTLRKMWNSKLSTPQRLDANQGVGRQKVEEILDYIQNCCKFGHAVNINQAAFVTVLNVLSNIAFSVDLANLNSETGKEFKTIVWGLMEEAGKPNFSDYFPLIRPLDLQGIRRRSRKLMGKLDKHFDRMIKLRLQSRESGSSPVCNDFLDTLLDHHNEIHEFEDGYPDIKALLRDMFIAGTDTTSSTIEWAMAELLHNPKVMVKARLELNEAMGKQKTIEESAMVRLQYLQAIVKETLRLHPATPFLVPHKADTDVEIDGFVVPKHAQVLVNTWAIGRDPKTWENPSAFMPERFLGSNIDFRGRDFELIPFGAGRRICPGLPLALRMVYLMLASLIHSFDWKLEDGIKPEDMDMEEKFGFTLQKARPLKAIPINV